MSQTELHIGKLRKVVLKNNQSFEEFYKEKLKERNITEIPSYYDNWEEIFQDELYDQYVVGNNGVWEIFDHIEKEDYDDIYSLKENPDGTLSFIMKFYNGGTCLSGCLTESINQLNK